VRLSRLRCLHSNGRQQFQTIDVCRFDSQRARPVLFKPLIAAVRAMIVFGKRYINDAVALFYCVR
jgi:hypothetical protein